jgi:carboxymethylenebutenolidase
MATTVTFKRPDGQMVQGYLAEPAHAAGAAAVVVIQEWWGINEPAASPTVWRAQVI